MGDLRGLIEAVEAGSIAQSDLDPFARVLGLTTQANDAHMAYRGSLDAAKALHEALLPGWWWTVGTCRVSDDARVSPEGPASVMKDGTEWSEFTDVDFRPSGNPARAWLLSILRALEAEGEA